MWVQWAPAILRLPHYSQPSEFQTLTSEAIQKAPKAVREWMIKVLNQENKENGSLWILEKFSVDCANILGPLLLDRLRKGRLKESATTRLLDYLVEHNIPESLTFARSLIPKRLPSKERARHLALHAASLLLEYGVSGDWTPIFRLINLDRTFGRSLLEERARGYYHQLSTLVRTLSESDISVLWEWVCKEYPPQDDPPERRRGRGGTVTTRWAIAEIRDGLLFHLAEIGSLASWRELLRLAKKYPGAPLLDLALGRGKEQTLRNTWEAPLPQEIFLLAENQLTRLIGNADQLLQVVCDSLYALQDKLHGATPAARFLWDADRPKEEEALSDWIKIELESTLIRRGIILNREVQIHIRQRTDIHVDAIRRAGQNQELDRLKVIIEVKGCWHRELKTAMENQLLKEYLANNDCHHGVYLVMWFLCSAWSKEDSRIKGVKFKQLKEVRQFLVEQSAGVCSSQYQIRSIVLDASLPSAIRRRGRRARHRES